MAQIKLLNGSGRTLKAGDPVKLHATKANSFDYAQLGSIVIGTLASNVRAGSWGLVNLVGGSVSFELTQEQIDTILAQIPPASVELTPEQIADIASQVPLTDITGKVDKVTGSSLLPDTEAAKIHTPGSDNQNLSNLVEKVTGSSLVPDTEISKIHAPGSDDQDLSGKADIDNPSFATKITTPEIVLGATPVTASAVELNLLDGIEGQLAYIGDYLKTINGESIIGTGDITVGGDFAGTMDDITDGATYVKTENNVTDALKTAYDGAVTHAGAAHALPATVLIVSGDKATGANTTPVTLGVSFTYAAGKAYVIDIYAMVAPTAATTGCTFLLDVDQAPGYIGSFSIHQLATSGTVSGNSSIGDAGATSKGVSSGMVGTGSNYVMGSMLLIGGANPGTATLYFQSETTAVTTCKSGTVFLVTKVN